MTTNRVFPVLLSLGLILIAILFLACVCPAGDPGLWECCRGPWSAYTTYRSMEGLTSFECGGICGGDSHTQPTSWMDITGGISQSQEDHSDSFAVLSPGMERLRILRLQSGFDRHVGSRPQSRLGPLAGLLGLGPVRDGRHQLPDR
jgi:hypothetical protein